MDEDCELAGESRTPAPSPQTHRRANRLPAHIANRPVSYEHLARPTVDDQGDDEGILGGDYRAGEMADWSVPLG